ncbi:MAG: putative lipopolysaccharide heptosyltransferase III [Methylococcaceae bacterium]|nr:putative lipopolysaccharide heptosyltransferase III [Methylococcaceae bacterium]
MNSPLFVKTSPQRILVITLRFLGDTLLTTPLINSLKKAYPDAEIDVLIYQNNAAILEGNPAISKLISTVTKPNSHDNKRLFKQIFRRYDLAVCTQTGDRPTLYAFLAAPVRIGLVPPRNQKGWFKRYLFQRYLEFDVVKTHTVLELLRLCQLLAIDSVYELTPPSSTDNSVLSQFEISDRYVVMHIMPQWRYKQWTDEGWIAVANYFAQQGFQILLSGSPVAKEVNYLTEIQKQFPNNTVNLAGKLSLAQLAQVIKDSRLFIGPDTGITHLAAATGVKTIALFGPSDPVKWTPWPTAYHSNTPPFASKGSQHVNNVYLIQGQKECVPCYLEGCDRHQQSYSACLDAVTFEQVKETINHALNE